MTQAIRFDLIAGVDKWNRGFRDAERTSSRFGARLRTTIATGGAAAAAAIGAVAVGAFKLGESFDSAYDTIRVTTGKTGKTLDGLQRDFKAVVKDVPTDFESAATAVGKLNQRTGQTGKGLQRLAAQELELSRITKTDLGENIAASTRLFRDWSIPTRKQAGTLDEMFRAAQATGIGVTDLMEKVVQFGSPLRQLGFNLDQTTALFGEFERAGVVTETVLPGLKMALKNYALAHKDPQKALIETIRRIKESSTTAQANTIAFKTFGARAGPDLAAAIREGHFDLDLLIKTISSGKDTIRGAAADTADFAQKWKLFSNRMKVLVEPAVSALFTGIGKLADKLGKDVFPAVQAFITTHGPQFKTILDSVKRAFDTIYNALADPEKGVVPNLEKLRKSWEDNRQAIIDFQDAIPGANTLLHAAGVAVQRLVEEVTGAGKLLIGLGAMASRGALAVRVALDGLGIAALKVVGFFQTMALHFIESLQTLAGAADRVFHTKLAQSLQGAVDSAKRARADTQAQIDKLKADGSKRFDELKGHLQKPISTDNFARMRHDAQAQIDAIKGKTVDVTASTKVDPNVLKVFTAAGGRVRFMARGGRITEGSGPTADDVLIRASKRETVVSAADSDRPEFQAWASARGIPGFAAGGRIYSSELGMRDRASALMVGSASRAAKLYQQMQFTNIPHVAGSWKKATEFLRTLGIAFNIISTFRAGARTHASGAVSFHALNRAVDLDGPNKLAIFNALTRTNPTELIYSRASRYKSRSGWHPISRLDPITRADHYSHVHAAYDKGGWLPPGTSVAVNRTGRPEPVGPHVTNIYVDRRLLARIVNDGGLQNARLA